VTHDETRDPSNALDATTSHIVVGFDYSPLAELALGEAAAIAARDGDVVIHVVHVIESRVPSSEMAPLEAENVERIRPDIEFALRMAEAPAEQQVFSHIRWGQASSEILALAEEVEADMIIVGTHGRTGLVRLVLGSIAERVVRHATCPVLVMRPRAYAAPEIVPEPPCPDCVQIRKETGGAGWWCEVHQRPWTPPHRYAYRNGGLESFHSMMGP
jgi:nucleotide-binding universal stress UspA family protein